MVELTIQSGTKQALESGGVRATARNAAAEYPDMPLVSRGWTQISAWFKGEGTLIGIGLREGVALETFKRAVVSFRVVS